MDLGNHVIAPVLKTLQHWALMKYSKHVNL